MVGYFEPRRRLARANLSPSPFFRKAAEARRHGFPQFETISEETKAAAPVMEKQPL